MKHSSKTLCFFFAGLVLSGCGGTPVVKPDRPAPSPPLASNPKPPAKDPAPVIVEEKDPAVQFEEALAALKAKKFPEARAGFEILAKKHPEFSGPLTNLAILDTKTDKRAAAASNFQRAVAANPRNAIAYNWLGILYREAKDYTKAEQAYQQSLSINPDNPAVVLNLAILNDVYLKRPGEALTRYREYQRMTNNRELKVTAWIKALEAAQPATPPVAPSPEIATPAAPKKT